MLLDVTDLQSELSVAELMAELVPPKEFTSVSFENYVPDVRFPSQNEAVIAGQAFAKKVSGRKNSSTGIYLDGGFGVGKTHLLASIYHDAKCNKLFGPFIAFTSIIGYLGFQEALTEFGKYELICIDEFELDDPGDTMMMSRLLKELAQKNISFAATSNTPPNALGSGRFAAEGFQREIASVADKFTIMRIDGEDYRHRSSNYSFKEFTDSELKSETSKRKLCADFSGLLKYLSSIHQSRYAKVAEQFDVLALSSLYQIDDQFEGLRFVSFIDRCYEAGISLQFTGISPDQVFRADHVAGAYQKKYLRCVSRLYAMNARP
jgi:cell division protein ZapE